MQLGNYIVAMLVTAAYAAGNYIIVVLVTIAYEAGNCMIAIRNYNLDDK